MAGEDRVLMSEKELRRVHVIHQVRERTLTQVQAGELLGMTSCQIRRLLLRVERLFKTFQDRLIKELRLARVATREAANQFLERDLPRYNRRFAVAPAQPADLHRLTLPARELDRSWCLKTTRCLRKDFTIAHAGQLYQLHDTIRARHVLVEQRLDGMLRLTHQGRPRDFHAIAVRPVSVTEAKPRPRFHRPVTPAPNHPWRKPWQQERGQHPAAAGP